MTTETNSFSELYAINVSEHVEKKGRFSYLSWPYAVAELRKRHPDATWTVVKTNGVPYIETSAGVFVEVSVTVNGVSLSQIHPVLNAQNKPIPNPNAFDINTSIQRCLVKAIALHGLGLYIYAGEDLPDADAKVQNIKQPALGGIGKDLTPDWKLYLEGLADDVENCVKGNAIGAARALIEEAEKENDLDENHLLYMQGKLSPTARKALGMTYVKAA
jgi:hypothetical protein